MNTADQYLKAIYIAEQLDDGSASTSTLADILEVSPASATEMVDKLEDQGLVEHEKYNGTQLTTEGTKRAKNALETYCILQRFLRNVLDVDQYRAEARALEAVIDETVAQRLDTIIDRPESCPDCFDPTAEHCHYLGSVTAEREAD